LEDLAKEEVGIHIWAILSILPTNGIIYGHLEQFVVFWYIFPLFGMLYREKYGNPGLEAESLAMKKSCFLPVTFLFHDFILNFVFFTQPQFSNF
jgi:hypothetical protein